MSITYHTDIDQGSGEWLELRRGILTASEMKLILTPTLKTASNDKERAHMYELLAQRISGFVEPSYISDDMLRGKDDELYAREVYSGQYHHVAEMGFITNDRLGFKIGYSPDGLVGDDGLIECKSRRQKFQIETIIRHEMPADYMIQVQTGLMVSERQWCDFVSYSSGLPMVVIRVYPDPKVIDAIKAAACAFEERLRSLHSEYIARINSVARLIPTERRIQQEIYL